MRWLSTLTLSCAVVVFSGCVENDRSYDTLHDLGFTQIQLLGWAPLSCLSGHLYQTAFSAYLPSGKAVRGVVCCPALDKAGQNGCLVRLGD